MRSRTLTLSARWVFPVEGEPIADGSVTIEDGRIARVGPSEGTVCDLDLGNAAIVPGFVNAHTHLELSPLGSDGQNAGGPEDEIDWLKQVIGQRRTGSAELLRTTSARNLERSIAAGTTLLADVTTAGLSWEAVAGAPVRAVVFAELIGLRRERAMETSQTAFAWMSSIKANDMVAGCARPGLSPHAPYSTAGWLYSRAGVSKAPLCTHLAEMPEELELLATGEGRLRRFLEDLGAWDDEWEPLGPRPADYIRRGDLRHSDWLVAHGNYLTEYDFWQFLPDAAPGGQRVAVAYCPRTAARFGHDRSHPFRAMLERGIDRLPRHRQPRLGPEPQRARRAPFPAPLRPVARRPAASDHGHPLRRLGPPRETVTGSLMPGKSADLAVVALPDRDADDPHTLLLESDLPVVATAFEGAFVHGPWVGV